MDRLALPILLFGLGCSSGEATGPATWLKPSLVNATAPATEEAPPSYAFRFLEPTATATARPFRPGEPIPCRFTLEVPEGARPPSTVILQLMRGDLFVDTLAIEPEGPPVAGKFSFAASLKGPSQPGRYHVRAHVLVTIHYLGGPQGQGFSTRDIRVNSPLVAVLVKQGR
jgi:hypothetical protein